jgi:hypothetical protein
MVDLWLWAESRGAGCFDRLTLALLLFFLRCTFVTTEAPREITISTLRALIDLQREEEKRLRSLIMETTSPTIRLDAILDLEQLLHQIEMRGYDLASLEAQRVSVS